MIYICEGPMGLKWKFEGANQRDAHHRAVKEFRWQYYKEGLDWETVYKAFVCLPIETQNMEPTFKARAYIESLNIPLNPMTKIAPTADEANRMLGFRLGPDIWKGRRGVSKGGRITNA